MSDARSHRGFLQAKVWRDFPNSAIQCWLTTRQRPGRELPGGYMLLFHTCLAKKEESKGRAGEEFDALRLTLVHSGGQKHYSM